MSKGLDFASSPSWFNAFPNIISIQPLGIVGQLTSASRAENDPRGEIMAFTIFGDDLIISSK
jgi:hypothetical protein